MSKVMTIASSCGWWTLSASLSVNVMVYSFVTFILGDRPESWTFCITFRYVFLDLEDCHVEVPPIITLISPSEGRDNSSSFPFNFSSLWSHPKKFLNFPCLMRFFIYYFKSKHSSVSCAWSLWNRQYLFLLRLLGSSFTFFDYFKDGSSLICISTCSSGMFKCVYCWLRVEELAFLLSRSFFSLVRAFFGRGPCSGWRRRSASICSALFLFLAIIASSAFMKFWAKWTSSAMLWGFYS